MQKSSDKNMQPRNWSLVFYILLILCNVLLVTNVNVMGEIASASADSNGNISNSNESLKTTATYDSPLVKGSNQTKVILVTVSKQNITSNSTTTSASVTTVAMSTSGTNSSQAFVTTGSVQTTAPFNVSSHSTPELSTTSSLNSTATSSQVTTVATSVLKPTQTESTVTSSTHVTQPPTGSLYSIITTTTSGSILPLKKEEVILTICLSTVLCVVILTIVMYNVNKCRHRREQYSHHPLYINSQVEPGFPSDTLVISGGLYDESRVYNPNMTVVEDDDELHAEYPAFSSRYSQFKLEFLPEEREATGQGSSFGTFQPET